MTPMIDVLLVLLIIFMAAAPGNTLGLAAAIPQTSPAAAPEAPKSTIILELRKDGSLRLNTQRLSPENLPQRLADVFQLRSDRTMFLKAAPELEYREVAALIDVSRHAGVDRVALLPGHF